MTASYYLWRWAANNLPGRPSEVFADLVQGKMPAALRPFDARPMLQDLQAMAATREALGEHWEWQVQPTNAPKGARFIFLQCPRLASHGVFRPEFKKLVYPWGLSGYDVQENNLIDCLLPKLNVLVLKVDPTETNFDVGEDDLADLLRRLSPKRLNTGYLVNSVGDWVECTAYRDGFMVEWTAGRYSKKDADYEHWRVGYLEHWDERRKPRYKAHRLFLDKEWHTLWFKEFPQEKLRFSDTLRIFQAFLRGESHQAQYHWRSIRPELERAKQRLRAKRRSAAQ